MGTLIGVGFAVGVVAAAWAVVFAAATKAKSVKGMMLSVVLAVSPIVYFNLPDEVTPKPGQISRSAGWMAGPTDGVVFAVVILAVAVAGFLIASKVGWIRSLTRRLDGSSSHQETLE